MPSLWVKKRLYKCFDKRFIERIFQNAPLSNGNIALLLLLQLCFWGGSALSFWQDGQHAQLQIEKAQSKLVFQNRLSSGNYFPEYLKQKDWLTWAWGRHSCDTEWKDQKQNQREQNSLLSFCLEIEGTAEEQEWRTALSQLDEFAAFSPVAMQWERFDGNKVQGKLRLQPIKNTANRLAQSFYPFPLYPNVPFSDEVLLVGSVFTQQKWRSLLVVEDKALSVSEGDWLPEIMASVSAIGKNKIELEYVNGKVVPVFLRNDVKGGNL